MGISVKRTIRILELVAGAAHGLTYSEIAKGVGAAKSSIAPIVNDLVEMRYLSIDPATKRYVPGTGALTLAQRYAERLDILTVARPFLADLRDRTGETIALTINNGEAELMIAQESSPHPLRPVLEVGARLPLHAGASGKAVLAFSGEEERERYLATVAPTPDMAHAGADQPALQHELREIRARGVAYGRDSVVEGVTGISAPVLGFDGRPLAAVVIQVPTARLTRDKETLFERALLEAVAQLSQKLGYTGDALRGG